MGAGEVDDLILRDGIGPSRAIEGIAPRCMRSDFLFQGSCVFHHPGILEVLYNLGSQHGTAPQDQAEEYHKRQHQFFLCFGVAGWGRVSQGQRPLLPLLWRGDLIEIL